MRGKKAGKETVEHISKIYEEKGTIPFIEIFGSFCFVILHPNGKMVMFTDNSNMRTFYIGQKFIGTNYLEVIKEKKEADFDLEGLCEFFVLGSPYFEKTLLKEIKMSDTEKYYIYHNGELSTQDKGIGGIEGKTSIVDVHEFFKEMSYALSELRVTMSLTGGYDSRLVFACINDYLEVKPFISGDNEKHKDIKYSQKVAAAGGNKSEVIKVIKPKINNDFIQSLFYSAQGIVPFVNNGYIRICSFILERKEKEFQCYLTGDGGVSHKDWNWTQDLPFYNKKNTDIARFYDIRMLERKLFIPFGDALVTLHDEFREKMITQLQKFAKPTNTQSYDSFAFYKSGYINKIEYNTFSEILPSYAPLWELELVRYSYHLPRRKRFFSNSMREITTKASKRIARVPTDYGTTASSETLYIIRDSYFQIIEYFKKACRLLGRIFLKRDLLVRDPATWSIEKEVRSLPHSKEAVDYCVGKGYFKRGTLQEDLSFEVLGRIIQVYLLAKYIEDR